MKSNDFRLAPAIQRVLICGAILSVALSFSQVHKAHAAPIQIGQNSEICRNIQDQIRHIPLTASVYDWPKMLHFSWLTWPVWDTVDPNKDEVDSIALIKKSTMWSGSREFYDSDSEYVRMTGGTVLLNDAWKKYWLPNVEAALNSHSLEMQTANIAFSNDEKGAILIRFRIKPRANVDFEYLTTHQGGGVLYIDGNWVYVVKSTKINSSISDTPIGSAFINVEGELGYIYSQPVVFETSGGYFQAIDPIAISNTGDEFHSVFFSESCFLELPSYLKMKRIPSQSELLP